MSSKTDTNQKINELKNAIKISKRSLLIVLFFSLFINILMLVSPMYMLQLYDRVLSSRSQETLLMLTLIVIILFITMALLEIVRSKILIRIGNKFDSILSERIFDSIFELEQKNPGKGSSIPLGDLSQLRQFMTGSGLFSFFDAPWIPIYIGVLFIFHPIFGFFGIFAAIVLIIITLINELTTKEKLNEANSLNRNSTIFVDNNIRNAEVIHALGMKENIKNKWSEKYYNSLAAQSQASDQAGLWSNISKVIRLMFQSLMLGIGAYLAINNEVSPGMMIAGSIIMGRALSPIDMMVNSWKGFSTARTSYERIDKLLLEFPENKDYMSLPAPKGELTLENVFLVPPGSELPTLKNISLSIDKGDIVGIIGPSAAGKSSLARAILGLWPLRNGKVRLDKADIHQWNKTELGNYIGYLPQDIELFEGTISENICRFQEINPEKIIQAAQIADVHEMILRLPNGYDTVIGVGGSSLSGGQKQRIGFARAIYNSPAVIVLDEPNSNLDEQGELAFKKAILKLKESNTTIIIVTHKPSILQVTNKVAILDQGTLKAFGNTAEILSKVKSNNEISKSNQTITLSKPN